MTSTGHLVNVGPISPKKAVSYQSGDVATISTKIRSVSDHSSQEWVSSNRLVGIYDVTGRAAEDVFPAFSNVC